MSRDKDVELEKPCPKCGTFLHEKYGARYCRNGCEIYTACPPMAQVVDVGGFDVAVDKLFDDPELVRS